MSKKQRLVVIVLGILDCLVFACLLAAMVFTPRLMTSAPTPTPTLSPTPTNTLEPTYTPTPTFTPAPTRTPLPTATSIPSPTPVVFPTRTPTPTPQVELLQNAGFEQIYSDMVPGWEFAADVNWQPGDLFDPNTSYGAPYFKRADDPARYINGATLQIESAHQYVKFRVTLYQTVELPAGTRVQFAAKAGGFSSSGAIIIRIGIDPRGRPACQGGLWSEDTPIDQNRGVVELRSPRATVGDEGRVTVCLFAEPQYAVVSKAAYFDDAELLILPNE